MALRLAPKDKKGQRCRWGGSVLRRGPENGPRHAGSEFTVLQPDVPGGLLFVDEVTSTHSLGCGPSWP